MKTPNFVEFIPKYKRSRGNEDYVRVSKRNIFISKIATQKMQIKSSSFVKILVDKYINAIKILPSDLGFKIYMNSRNVCQINVSNLIIGKYLPVDDYYLLEEPK